ncbi:MAG: ribbon-helix-helix protein, CopG family [Halobacteriota archaeon]
MQRYVYPVDLTEVEKELNSIAEKLKVSKAEAIREAIKFYARELQELEVVEIRDVKTEQAKKEIMEYIKDKDRVWADEIADSLRLDLSVVNDLLMELWSERYVEPED